MPKSSFIIKWLEKAKGFDVVLKNVKILSADNGCVSASMPVCPEHLNEGGTLHGGLSATLVDVISGAALQTHANGLRPSVSVNINMTYMAPAKLGEEILINARTLKVGKTLAFLHVDIFNKETDKLLVTGEHTKFLLDQKK